MLKGMHRLLLGCLVCALASPALAQEPSTDKPGQAHCPL